MSKRGNCCDNAMAENFFSILKTECIYRHQAATFEEANILIDNYIFFYNHQRIQLKTQMQSAADGIPDSIDAPAPSSKECGVSIFCFIDLKNSSN